MRMLCNGTWEVTARWLKWVCGAHGKERKGEIEWVVLDRIHSLRSFTNKEGKLKIKGSY